MKNRTHDRLAPFRAAVFLSTLLTLLPGRTAEGAAPATTADWAHYGGDPGGTRWSPLNQIHRRNVHQLALAWVYRCDDARLSPATTIECNPLVVDGTMYLTTPGLRVTALEAATGRPLWTFDPWEGRGGRGVNRGLALWRDGAHKRLFLPAGPHVYAIDAATGKVIPTFGNHGRIDLREHLDQDLFHLSVTASSPGVVYRDLLIMGSSVGEGPAPAAPGHIRAYDVRTGERRWIFHTIPHPGEPGHDTWPSDAWKTIGGANAWGGLSLDPGRGLVFAGTGSASYDHFGGNRIGDNLYANSVLALDAGTGQRRWHFQTIHHDLWDYDLPCPPVLASIHRNGRTIPVAAQTTKTGFVFVFDRLTGKPIFKIEERPVPRSEIPGEVSSPTQPFPVQPPPVAQQSFSEADVTDRTPAARDAVLKQLRGMRTGGLYRPPGFKPDVMLPQFNGGAEWGGAAFDPNRGLLFVNTSNEAEWISMIRSKPADNVRMGELGAHLYRVICSTCHGFGAPQFPTSPSLQSLKSVKQRHTADEVLTLLKTGRGQMPSFESLSHVEHRALVAFLFDQGTAEPVPPGATDLGWASEIPYVATGHHEFRDPDGYPANRRPWGQLTAVDLARGTIRWQAPLGTYPELERQGHGTTGTFNIGGPIATAGGVVFIGATMDERFRAFDSRNGRILWEYQMDAGGYATPATYAVRGRQFVVIAAGGGGKPETKAGNAYYCFALPERN